MSRRKQGRPQQRKTLDSLEQEKDLLVCGDCQTSFPLHNIVQFIRHKKQCCDKENLNGADDACRKPGNGNEGSGNKPDNEINGVGNEEGVGDDDDEEEGADVSKSLSGRDEDESSDEPDDENEEDMPGHKNMVNGEATERLKKEEEDVKKEEKEKVSSSAREGRTPLRQKQVVDAESNTTHSEPSRFVCETCRSTYTSAWALLQHAQKEHGMKIYTSPSCTSSQPHPSSSALPTPVPNTVSPMDLVVASSPRSVMDHRSMSAGSGGSISPYPVHNSNPFASPFRLPLDSRLPHSTSISPFSRSSNFDFDVINDCRLRPQLLARGASGLEHHLFSPFDRSRPHISPALDSHYDYYSMRLKQLASAPVVSQAKSPFPASCPPHPQSVAVTPNSFKSDSPPEETSSPSPMGNNLTSSLTLLPKQKACEFCGKNFRFQSNLVVHRRSHTGEKPYKCPQCPHACTQQSKLKRHMKTHSQKADGTDSPNETLENKSAECNDDDADDDDDMDEDEEEEEDDDEEEEDCEDDDDMIEEEMNEEEREVLERMKKAKSCEEQTPEPGEIRHDSKRIKLEHTIEDRAEEDMLPSDLSMKSKPSESLLSEVMKRTGLNDIQTYNEAYKAALAESQENSKDRHDNKDIIKNSGHDRAVSPRSASPKSSKGGVKRELEIEKESDKEDQKEHLYLGGTDLLSKSTKRDPSATSIWPSSVESLPHNNIDPATASLYTRLHHSWFHSENPVRLFYHGYPPRFPHTRDLSLTPEGHNGLNLSSSVSTASSALKPDSPSIPGLFKPGLTSPNYPPSLHRGTSSSSSSPTGSLLMSNNSSSVITPPRKDSRRNDTCEFCGKVFKNCSNLTVHRRSHTGEKPYKCSLCSYACAQSSKLTRHMKTHGRLGKDVYTCKFCNMPFSVPSTLEKHMRKCVENRNARLLATDAGDLSSESNGEMSRQSDSASGLY